MTATSQGNTSTATLRLEIIDYNEYSPKFTNDNYTFSLNENLSPGLIGIVSATDDDRSPVTRFQLLSGDTNFFTIYSHNIYYSQSPYGQIYTTQGLDYEQHQELELVVMVYNTDNATKNSKVPVVIKVIDVNDNSPIFSRNNYTVNVPEYSVKGDVVEIITATDVDSGDFGTVIHSILLSLPIDNIFAINETTGVIYVASALLPDKEQNPAYALQIKAQDGGSPYRETITLVFISVIDVNEKPVLTQLNYTVELAEDVLDGTDILQVQATETRDLGNNSIITYFIIPPDGYAQEDPVDLCMNSSDTENSLESIGSGLTVNNATTEVCPTLFPFHINPLTGEITIQSSLDYEKNTSWVFTVVAKDSGIISLNDTAIVTVIVSDVNDNAPVFIDDPFNIYVIYLLPVGSVVTDAVKAYDADKVSDGNLRYYIISGDDGKFRMNLTTGQIVLDNTLDITTYVIRVQVTDGEFEAEIDVIINAVVNIKPEFSMDVFIGSFPEEEQAGYFILKITATDEDSVFYQIINTDKFFFINQTSGELFTNAVFDFETLPNGYNLTVEAYDDRTPPKSASATVVLSVTDINDNTPYFSNDSYTAELREGIYVQEFVIKLTAMDNDSGSNAEIEYAIVPTNFSSAFNISSEGVLTAVGFFDFDQADEMPRNYTFTITATDKGYPSRNGSTTVVINIVDINDNAPMFSSPSFQVLVPENFTVNQTVITVTAFDADSGINKMIRYEIHSSYPESCIDTYDIDAVTGNISLAKSIDFETEDDLDCSLFVEASDMGNPSRSGDVTIITHITNVNEFPPNIMGNLEAFVPENSPSGTVFYTLMGVDHDMNNVLYEVDDGEDVFSVNATSGEVSVAVGAMLDYEMTALYNITIIVKDDGEPVLSSPPKILTISITDENDQPPVFEQAAYYVSLREQTPVGSTILITRATDMDTPPNAQISYMFIANEEGETNYGKFLVNSSTGAVTISASLDYETEQHFYYMIMEASDGVNKDTVQVNIRVLESNDNYPVFNNLPNTTSVSEDADNDTFIFQATATDADFLVNGKIIYSLAQQDDPKFRIEPETGIIRVLGDEQFDFDEDIREYTITVIASDRGGQEPNGSNEADEVSGFDPNSLINVNDSLLSTLRVLVIAITDINDNAPKFLQAKYTTAVEEDEVNKIVILKVTAQDDDEIGTERSAVRYSIVSGACGHFEINSTSGIITSVPPIDRETNSSFEFIVKAYDLGTPSLNSSVLVNVTIIDIDDEAPRFNKNIYHANLKENSPEGTFVVKLFAVDNDKNTFGNISYTLLDNLEHFAIDNSSGIITTTSLPVDREVTTHFILSVKATDGAGLFDTATVIVTVIDENDNAPSFENNTYLFNISETTPIGSFVTPAITATDGDSGNFNITLYTLVQTAGEFRRFHINQLTGTIEVVGSLCLDLSPSQTYAFTVIAIDADPLVDFNDTAEMFIIVHEENNFSPIFTHQSYVGRLNKLAIVGSVVLPSLQATDQDICSGDPVFRIATGNVNNTFEINNNTGKVILARNLTENDFSFTLTLTATDTKIQYRTGSVQLIVLIGQLLPITITADKALTVPGLSKLTQTIYQQELWLHNGGHISSLPIVTYTLGNTQVNRTLHVEAAEAISITAILVTESVYSDRNEVMVALQVSADKHNQAYVRETEVYVTIVPPVELTPPATAIFGSCTTSTPGTGSYCLARVVIPTFWFDSQNTTNFTSGSGYPSSETVSVLYGLNSEQNTQQTIGDVSLISMPSCPNASIVNKVRVSVPLRENYPGETLEVKVAANAEYDITNYQFSCETEDGIMFTKVSSSNRYIIATEINGSIIRVSGINLDPHNEPVTKLEQLVTMEIALNESLYVTKETYFKFSCFVDHVVNVRVKESISQSFASHINLRQPFCEAEFAEILIAPKTLRGIFAYSSSNSILNTAKLNGNKVTANVTVIGVYNSGELLTEKDLQCETSAPLKITDDCEQVYQDGTESFGSNFTNVTITAHSGETATLFFRVWYPVETHIITESDELHRINGSFDSNCSNLYEKSKVEIEVVFQAGENLNQTTLLTSLLQNNIFSSSPDVIDLINGGVCIKAIGKSVGTAKLELRQNEGGLIINELELVVSDTPVSVEDLSLNLHTSLKPMKLKEATAGSQYNENALVEIETDVHYLNTPVAVVADAILSNGHTFELSQEDGLHLTSENEEVFTISTSEEIKVRGTGNGLLLRGNWTYNDHCSDNESDESGESVFSTAEFVIVSLVRISSIEASIEDAKLAVGQHARILNLPNSTSITANIVHADGERVDVTSDERTIFQDSENILVFSQGLVNVSAGFDVMTSSGFSDDPALTNITVQYHSSQVDTNVTIGPIEVVGIVEIQLKSYPHPGWIGAEPINTLRRYSGVSSFQKAQLKLVAILNNGDEVEITNASSVLYCIKNTGSEAKVNGSVLTVYSAPTIVNITAEVAGLLAETSIEILDEVVTVTNIKEFDLGIEHTFSEVMYSTAVVKTVGLLFSDLSKIPNLIGENGPIIDGLVYFNSSADDVVNIDSSSGEMTLLQNSYSQVQLLVTAYTDMAVNNSQSLYANLVPAHGDADFGSEIGSPLEDLSLNSSFILPIYINTCNTTVGAIELHVTYDENVLELISRPEPPSNLSYALFESSYNEIDGETSFGILFQSGSEGDARMHVGSLSFNVKSERPGFISVDVVTLNTYNTTFNDIGFATPRKSAAAQIIFSINDTAHEMIMIPSAPSLPVRCESPPCSSEQCTAIAGADANGDCVFDLLDALATLQQSAIGNSSSISKPQAMDADKNGRISTVDAQLLAKANFDNYPFITDINIQLIDPDCTLTVNMTLGRKSGAAVQNNTYIIFGLFHTRQEFQTQYDATTFSIGFKQVVLDLPEGAYGGWIAPEYLGNGIYGIRTEFNTISQVGIGFVAVYGDTRDIQSRYVTVIGKPTPPVEFKQLVINISRSELPRFSISLLDGFNAQTSFNNNFSDLSCYNMYPPVIQQESPYSTSRPENIAINSPIVTVNATDSDYPLPSGELSYTLKNLTQPGTLTINSVTGELYVSGALDYERYTEIRVTVVVTDQGPHIPARKSMTLDIVLLVNDTNDNPPVPAQSLYAINISEGMAAPSGSLLNISVNDNDTSLQFRYFHFVITSGDDPSLPKFNIGLTNSQLTLASMLDRETQDFYNLTVQITDTSSPAYSLTATTYIEVTVIDKNDNKPEFSSLTVATITENNIIGDSFYQANASDIDLDVNSEITYSIERIAEADDSGNVYLPLKLHNDLFSIDPTTGTVTANTVLDREGLHSFRMNITAMDKGTEPHTSILGLWVQVCELNDNAPQFNSSDGYAFFISENIPNGTIVGTRLRMLSSDSDHGAFCAQDTNNVQDNVIEYELENSDEIAIFTVRESGEIIVIGDIDYEKTQKATLRIKAFDLGDPPLETSTTVTINILDLNDNAPVFNQSRYEASLVDGATVGTRLEVMIIVTDRDSGKNGAFYISLSGIGARDFEIDETGFVRVNQPPNKGILSSYHLTISAVDRGSPSLNSTANLVINVIDDNDDPTWIVIVIVLIFIIIVMAILCLLFFICRR